MMEKKPQPKIPLPKVVEETLPKAPLPKALQPRTLSACREVAQHHMEIRQATDPVTGGKALRIDVKLEVLTSPDRATEFAEMLRYDAAEIEKHVEDMCRTLEKKVED